MTDDNRGWLQQLILACEGAAARLEARGDPMQEPLLEDIRALLARLQQRLDALDSGAAR